MKRLSTEPLPYKVGDPPPAGYIARYEWAQVQLRGGLRQSKCPHCLRWRFPQETCCQERTQ